MTIRLCCLILLAADKLTKDETAYTMSPIKYRNLFTVTVGSLVGWVVFNGNFGINGLYHTFR